VLLLRSVRPGRLSFSYLTRSVENLFDAHCPGSCEAPQSHVLFWSRRVWECFLLFAVLVLGPLVALLPQAMVGLSPRLLSVSSPLFEFDLCLFLLCFFFDVRTFSGDLFCVKLPHCLRPAGSSDLGDPLTSVSPLSRCFV